MLEQLRTVYPNSPISSIVPVIAHNNKELQNFVDKLFKEVAGKLELKVGVRTDEEVVANKGTFDTIEARTLSISETGALHSQLAEYIRKNLLASTLNKIEEMEQVYRATITKVDNFNSEVSEIRSLSTGAYNEVESLKRAVTALRTEMAEVRTDLKIIKELLKL